MLLIHHLLRLNVYTFNLSFLLYADDSVLLSQSAQGIQHCLNISCCFCQSWCLDIIYNKSKVFVSRFIINSLISVISDHELGYLWLFNMKFTYQKSK